MAAADVEETVVMKKSKFRFRRMFTRSKRSQSDAEESGSSSSGPRVQQEETLTCNVCFVQRSIGVFPVLLTCEHRTCMDCLRQYLTLAIKEWRVMVTCPECSEVFHPSDIKEILNDDHLYSKYEEFTLRRALVSIPDIRWCPAPDCVYAVIASGCASCPQLKCNRPGCKTEFCYHCRQVWHPNTTCDAARSRNHFAEIGSLSSGDRRGSSSEDMKPCPRCGALFIKMDDGSCNHMTCSVCGSEFCWLCMKEISDLHYLSPSGCTFWGKKPWSRKKKVLWQMGTLIGAPVGIALAASVVLPAMMIGIPIYVGGRIRDRFSYSRQSLHKRNVAIVGGVALSVMVSPFLAALTVGVGVPIALGYVYGVVPVSLCRSGGCTAVKRSSNGNGVNFEFDERDDGTVSFSDKNSPVRRNSHSSSMLDNASLTTQGGNVLTVKATVNKEPQPSITGLSQDSTSLDSRSLISHCRAGDGDVDSHASMIAQPRSTTVSITSSLENVHTTSSGAVNLCTGLPQVSCERDEPVVAKEDLTSNSSQTSSGSQTSKSEAFGLGDIAESKSEVEL